MVYSYRYYNNNMNMNMNMNASNDCIDQPFVYENYIATESTQSQQLQTQDQLVIEERGDPGSNIFTVADVFNHAQCDEIVNYIQKNSALLVDCDVGYNVVNNVECSLFSLNDIITQNISGAKELDKFIFDKVGAVLTAFLTIRPQFKGNQDDGYKLRRIHGGTKRHIDGVHSKTGGFTKFVRALSFIAVLNDDYDGGIFNFPNQNLKFKVKKGEVVLFPPYWTHPHSVSSVGEGQARYTINTWILEDFIGGHTPP